MYIRVPRPAMAPVIGLSKLVSQGMIRSAPNPIVAPSTVAATSHAPADMSHETLESDVRTLGVSTRNSECTVTSVHAVHIGVSTLPPKLLVTVGVPLSLEY